MLKNLFSNPVTRTFIALVITLLFVIGAFFIYITAPENFGHAGLKFSTDTVYYFADNWQIAYDYAKISFSPGTLVIPGYYRGQVAAVLLIPPEAHPGTASLTFPRDSRGELPETIVDNLDQAIILLDYSDYSTLFQDSGSTILLRADKDIEADAPHKYLELQLDQGRDLLTNYEMFGHTNWLLPTPQTVLLGLWGQRLGYLSYYEDATIKVVAPDFNLEFSHPTIEKQYYPPKTYKIRALAYMVFLTLAAISFIGFITGGLESEENIVMGHYNSFATSTVLIGTAGYAAALTFFGDYFQTQALISALLWALPLAGIAVWAHKTRLTPSFFGITTRGLGSGALAALGACALITLGSALALPTGINFAGHGLLPLALAILLREALIRGFFQRVVSHWLHPLPGILITSLVWALIAAFAQPGLKGSLFFPAALGKSLVVGYMYYRSGNLFTTCFLGVMLELAPLIIQF